MSNKQMRFDTIGHSIDRLVTVELRLSDHSRGVIAHLYQAAIAAQGGEPLSMRAARALQESLKPRDVVFIMTGAGNPDYLPCGETDGPPGAAALATALSQGLGVVPLLLTESSYMENLSAVTLAAGLGIRNPQVALRIPHTTAVLPLATDESASSQAQSYLEQFKPKAIISIEKIGPNSRGVAHTASGRPTGEARAKVEFMIDQAKEAGILTLGVGDNGNEIGYGLIEEAVRRYKPYGNICQCSCNSGLATRVATDILVAANTSNWGAYGIEAALAALLERPEIMHSPQIEQRMIEAWVDTGAADGSTGRHILAVDGTPLPVQLAVVTMLKTIIENGLANPPQRAF